MRGRQSQTNVIWKKAISITRRSKEKTNDSPFFFLLKQTNKQYKEARANEKEELKRTIDLLQKERSTQS